MPGIRVADMFQLVGEPGLLETAQDLATELVRRPGLIERSRDEKERRFDPLDGDRSPLDQGRVGLSQGTAFHPGRRLVGIFQRDLHDLGRKVGIVEIGQGQGRESIGSHGLGQPFVEPAAGAGLFAGDRLRGVGWIGLYTPFLLFGYLSAMRLAFGYEKRSAPALDWVKMAPLSIMRSP